MKLSDFFVLLDIQELLYNIDNPQVATLSADLNILLDKIYDEANNGHIIDDREPATIEDILKVLNDTTDYNFTMSLSENEEGIK